jgi:hypothetical protein
MDKIEGYVSDIHVDYSYDGRTDIKFSFKMIIPKGSDIINWEEICNGGGLLKIDNRGKEVTIIPTNSKELLNGLSEEQILDYLIEGEV